MRDVLDFILVTSSLGKDEAMFRVSKLKNQTPSVLKNGFLTHSFVPPGVSNSEHLVLPLCSRGRTRSDKSF